MFATVMTFDRDPMLIQDVPGQLVFWIQRAGGWAAVGVIVWLLAGYMRMRAEDRARIPSWQKTIFILGLVVALLGDLSAGAIALLAMPLRRAEDIEKYYRYASYALTIGGAGALLAAGLPFLIGLSTLRFRRIWAMAKLSFKEAIRNRVLYGFSALLLVLLFGSWFIPYKPESQVRIYVGLVYGVMQILLLLTAIIVAAFSIPTDIRRQTIHTIVTKPVERLEIILGRFFGFTALMTLVLLLMTSVSVIYVLRGVDREAADESLKAREPYYGTLHFLNTESTQKGTNVGREWDYRSYITVAAPNQEPQYAVWDFNNLPQSLAGRNTVRCEFAFDIYRTTKGWENQGVSCKFEFQTANFNERDKDRYNSDHSKWTAKSNLFKQADIDDWLADYRERLTARSLPAIEIENRVEDKRTRLTEHKEPGDPPTFVLSEKDIENELAEEYGYYVKASKEISDYHTLYIDVPAGLFRSIFQGKPSTPARPDVPQLQARVSVTQQSVTQYVGMAKYDLYWRLDDPNRGTFAEQAAFALNFYKGALGLWLRLCLVTGLAVALSTYLSGVISMLVAGLFYLGGCVIEYIASIGLGTAYGGGPMEALVRLANRQVALVPLDEGPAANFAASTDVVFRWCIRRVLDLIPDVGRYDLTDYVGAGFNIPLSQLLLNFGALGLYLLPWLLAAYYLLKWREIAGPT